MVEEKDKEIEEIFDIEGMNLRQSLGPSGGHDKAEEGEEGGKDSDERVDVEKSGNRKKATWIVGILVFGVVVLVLGWLKIKNVINSPFVGYGPEYWEDEVKQGVTNELLAMQNKDTDKDGLSDYDETYIYKTSMYIEDTDSDGFLDREEVEKGSDPLCPNGMDCYGETRNQKLETRDDANDEESDFRNPTSDIRVEELRGLLVEAGMDEGVLEEIDDETLLNLYGEALQEIQGDSELSQMSSNISNDNDIDEGGEVEGIDMEELANLTADEIRELLIAGGADAETVNTIDDETLREVYLETLGEME